MTELAKRHPGKCLPIKGKAVHGAFKTCSQGVTEGTVLFSTGRFPARSVSATSNPEAPSIPTLSIGLLFVSLAHT